MKCFEEVIVTLRFPWIEQDIDMQLPSFMPMEELTVKLLETLRLMMPETFVKVKSISLKGVKGVLYGQDTLAGAGIWDGSIVTVEKNRGE